MPRKRTILAPIREPTRDQMWDSAQTAIIRASNLTVSKGQDEFIYRTGKQLASELMVLIDAYAVAFTHAHAAWKRGNPQDKGYYLAAWKDRTDWVVSELWYNPESVGTGWWSSRLYLGQEDHRQKSIDVVAWMDMPVFRPDPREGA